MLNMRIPIIAGNWKMYKTISEAVNLAKELRENLSGISDREIVICPPFTALSAVKDILAGSNIQLGAQDMYWEKNGAYTGEISPLMLIDLGCHYCIIGHSERRQFFAETDETLNRKTKTALNCGIVPIVCIGETLSEREKNLTFQIIEKQIKNGLVGLSNEQAQKLVIAYEPVWAIGTGKTATPEQAEEVHKFIRNLLGQLYNQEIADNVRILYGGSVRPDNIKVLMSCPNIDGGLVGGASLEAKSFIPIVKYDQ
jgi:triosephosphate isomerase